MNKILSKRVGTGSRLVKIAASNGGLDFNKILQDRNVRSGLAGLGVAGISKLLGAGWGTSALLGLGSAAAAHYGQKAWDKYNADKQYNALPHEDKLKLEEAKQQQLATEANVVTEKNKQQVARKKLLEAQAKALSYAQGETARIEAMSPEQRLAYFSQQEELRRGLEDWEKFQRGMLEEEEAYALEEENRQREAALKPVRQNLAKLNLEHAKLSAKMGKTNAIYKPEDFSNFMWLRTGYDKVKDWNDRRLWAKGADARRLKELENQIKKLQKQLAEQNY